MNVVFHAHNAVISDRLQQRAGRTLRKLARRLDRVVDAVIRFHQDGPTRRVEITLHAGRHQYLVAQGFARYYGPALNTALAHLEAQIAHGRRQAKQPGIRFARA